MSKTQNQKKPTQKKVRRRQGTISLYPLSFDEAVTDIMKVKPEPKTRKKRKK